MAVKSRLPTSDRILVCDIDNTLIGDREALAALLDRLRGIENHIGFGVATGRRIESARDVLKKWGVPMPDFFITAVGTEIHYGRNMIQDVTWRQHIQHQWKPMEVLEAMKGTSGLRLQPQREQREFKISYFIDPDKAPPVQDIIRMLRKLRLHVNVVYCHGAYLDILPVRASKGAALRYIADKWGIDVEHILAAGDSGNDEEMLSGQTLGVVVGNHSIELEKLRGRERVHFAAGEYAWGIIEGIEHYDFLGSFQGKQKAELV